MNVQKAQINQRIYYMPQTEVDKTSANRLSQYHKGPSRMDEVVNICDHALNTYRKLAEKVNSVPWDPSEFENSYDENLAWANHTIESFSKPDYSCYESTRLVKIAVNAYKR